ncbi:methylated-DNA--[protein]-cysteine S-methyltransferase [Vibrio astriarenae]|uniref:Methylated-DNA--[protein]-cysteine S-methyltransferase n=1 Tax=Vibrio astriarenae TaxID=1481923 RepID=A0A7Z2T3Z9_9VIBR|nr:MGMT family protein [Vibrio astriarenae]QIA63850.1 methylated-DNA--[protein]-cysteine S-methyltransferase [Vibrio astriarenae]
MNEFLAQIFAVIHQIPHGQVSTYGDIAKLAGYPGYARQVGAALKNLPQGTKLPWHRVINSQGKISLQGSDLARQMEKLRDEGVKVETGGKISLRHYRWSPD